MKPPGMNHRWLRIPPNPPMKQFWAVSVYDIDTRHLFRNEKLKDEGSSTRRASRKTRTVRWTSFSGRMRPRDRRTTGCRRRLVGSGSHTSAFMRRGTLLQQVMAASGHREGAVMRGSQTGIGSYAPP
jgi:hypothetical protein